MAKRQTKNLKSFVEKGFYNPETFKITGTKDGEDTDIREELARFAKEGMEISIVIKQEDTIEDIVEG